MRLGKAVALLILGWLMTQPAAAVDTAFWQVGSFENLLQGTLQGVSLTKDGQLTLAPEARAVFNPDETLALSLASDHRGNLFIGTGHQGKVFRVDAQMKGTPFFTAPEPDIFALVVGPDGALYVGTSPEGKVYRVTPDGKSQVFFDPKAKYIWALEIDKQGHLYVGTGDRGLIFKIDPDGKGKLFFDSKQTHIMCLTRDASGSLLAGSFPNGLIYKINSEGKAFVLFQSSMPEIHDLAVDERGRIYAAALGGGPGQGVPFLIAPQGQGGPDQGAVTTVTVTASTEGDALQSAGAEQPPGKNPKQGPSFNRSSAIPFAAGMPKPPQGQGALIRILPNYSAETIWSSNKESIFGLALKGERILFTTDEDGRIFQLNPSLEGQNLTLLAETHESLATRLLFEGADLYVATSNIAKLVRLGSSPGQKGSYESPVKDTKFVSRWGVLAWRGSAPEGASIEFFTRSGNSNRPDETWGDWTGPYGVQDGSPIKSQSARYLQWKAVFKGSVKGSPILDDVTVSYLNQNLPPQIRSLNVSTSDERTGPAGSPSPTLVSGVSGATVTVTTVSPSSINPGSTSGAAAPPSPTVLTWQVEDPNGDSLLYSLYVKAADEKEWHLLKDQLQQTSFAVESNALADGRYVARLVASDENSNPPSMARRDELLSAPFWIDHTPPQVQMESQKPIPGGVEIHFRAEDDTSPLKSAEASTDAKEWHNVEANDGIVDSRTETFMVRLENPAPGEHVVTLRAYDTAGNTGLGKAVVLTPAVKAAAR